MPAQAAWLERLATPGPGMLHSGAVIPICRSPGAALWPPPSPSLRTAAGGGVTLISWVLGRPGLISKGSWCSRMLRLGSETYSPQQ